MGEKIRRVVATGEDWYQVHGVEDGYEEMYDLLLIDVNMDKVWEIYYEQNMDSNRFRSNIISTMKLDSRTELILEIKFFQGTSLKKTDKGLFGLIRMEVKAVLEVKLPGSRRLPKAIASLLKRIWWRLAYQNQWRYWTEFAEERLFFFLQKMRNYYGLKPPIGRTKRVYYKPLF